MKTDIFGKVQIDQKQAFDALYNGTVGDLSGFEFDSQDIVNQFNSSVTENADGFPRISLYQILDTTVENFDLENQNQWFMPNQYKLMDIEGFLVDQCPKQNYERLVEELALFRQHDMINLLKYLKYLVDIMRENNIVWGVGRGSSVASYVLYLLGVHKIDSIKYGLDIREFLK